MQFRPILTTYYQAVLRMKYNMRKDTLNKLSATDVVKMCIERGYESMFGEKLKPDRKRYETLPF